MTNVMSQELSKGVFARGAMLWDGSDLLEHAKT